VISRDLSLHGGSCSARAAHRVSEALTGALRKLESLLESKFGQIDDRRGAATIRRIEEA